MLSELTYGENEAPTDSWLPGALAQRQTQAGTLLRPSGSLFSSTDFSVLGPPHPWRGGLRSGLYPPWGWGPDFLSLQNRLCLRVSS